MFWQVTSGATLNGVTFFAGTVVAQANVTLGVGAALSGRALATTAGSVTLSGGNTVGGCSAAGGGCPTITLTPPTLPTGRWGWPTASRSPPPAGTGTIVFSVLSGTLPAGLTLTSGGLLAGTPTTAGSSTVTIQATDGNGCPGVITYTIVIAAATCPVITLAPPTLPTGKVGVAYSQQITASGGTGTIVFSVLSGTLPAGLTLTPAGLLAGTPTAVAPVSSTVTIQATDGNGCPGVITYTIVIAAATCPVITLAPATLPNGTVGVPYSQTITGSGGTAPYTFTLTGGALPAGLTLTPAGVVSGTPTANAISTFTIRGTDANGCFAELTYVVLVAVAVPTLPQVFLLMLALGLIAAGYLRLRQRARSE